MNSPPEPPPPPPPPPGMPAPPGGAPLGGALYPPGSGGVALRADAIVQRNSAMVIVWSLLTCGIYGLYWYYRTTSELKDASGDDSIKPGIDLLLLIVSCGLWGLYVGYRNGRKVYDLLRPVDPGARDQSTLILILNVAALVVGVTAFVAQFLLQEEYNRLGRLGRSTP